MSILVHLMGRDLFLTEDLGRNSRSGTGRRCCFNISGDGHEWGENGARDGRCGVILFWNLTVWWLVKELTGWFCGCLSPYSRTLPDCRIPAGGSPARAQPLPWAGPRWICRSLWSESSSAAHKTSHLYQLPGRRVSWWCAWSCLHSHSTHHISVVLVGEVKGRQEGLELVEDLVVSRHVSGQNASAPIEQNKKQIVDLLWWKDMRESVCCENLKHSLTWWFPLWSVCTDP